MKNILFCIIIIYISISLAIDYSICPGADYCSLRPSASAVSAKRPEFKSRQLPETLFSEEEREVFKAQAALLKKLYPHLSIESKRLIFRPDIFSVFLGIKPAFKRCQEDKVNLKPLGDDLIKLHELIGEPAVDMLFLDNYIINIDLLLKRLKAEGEFLVNANILTQDEIEEANTQNVDKIIEMVEERCKTNESIRSLFEGFLLGYPLEDIVYFTTVVDVDEAGYTTPVILASSKYGFELYTPKNQQTATMLIRWDIALDCGYSFFEDEAGFDNAVPESALEVYKKTKGRAEVTFYRKAIILATDSAA